MFTTISGRSVWKAFSFGNNLDSFTMNQVVIQMTNQSTTSWQYTGTETGRELVDAPDCECQ